MSSMLPNLSNLPVSTEHDGNFEELSDEEVKAMTAEERKAYLEHKAKHDAKKKPASPRRGG